MFQFIFLMRLLRGWDSSQCERELPDSHQDKKTIMRSQQQPLRIMSQVKTTMKCIITWIKWRKTLRILRLVVLHSSPSFVYSYALLQAPSTSWLIPGWSWPHRAPMNQFDGGRPKPLFHSTWWFSIGYHFLGNPEDRVILRKRFPLTPSTGALLLPTRNLIVHPTHTLTHTQWSSPPTFMSLVGGPTNHLSMAIGAPRKHTF